MSWFWYRGKPASSSRAWDASAASPRHARLESLYSWERRCRGYDLFPEAVALEPAFAPWEAQRSAQEWEAMPQPRYQSVELSYLSLRLPLEQAVTPAQMALGLTGLRALRHLLALEIVADARRIVYQVSCAAEEAAPVAAALQGAFPTARVERAPDAVLAALAPLCEGDAACQVVDFGLKEAVYRPLRLVENLTPDPHGALLSVLGSLGAGEMAGLQLLLCPAHSLWAEALCDLVANFDGASERAHPGTRDSDLERALRYKLASPLWVAALRLFAVADNDSGGSRSLGDQALGRCQQMAGALAFTGERASNGVLPNHLLALDDSGYDLSQHLSDVLKRQSRRPGMLLSQAELVGLWHPPTPLLQHPRLWRHDPRYRELPPYLRDAPGVALGVLQSGDDFSASSSEPALVPWPDVYRNRHAYLLGATRMGKSTLLGNLIVQDLMEGRGLCLIDPHGDLAHDVLRAIPPRREEDVLFLDLSDTAHPVSMGLLQTRDEWEKRLLVSDLLSILHRLFASSWGDRLEHILRHVLLTLLSDEAETHTLRDIRPLLSDPAYREPLVARLPDPDLRSFWSSEFPGYSGPAFAPVFNKLGLLLSSPLVRNIVAGESASGESASGKFANGESATASPASAAPRLDPAALIAGKKVLIVNLAQSLIGEDNAHFLGALLVSKIQLAAMHSLRQGREERVPFTLYVDEFQNFVVSSFAKILSEAGKAGLSLVMANQFLEQLPEGLQTAVLSNVGALVSFRVSASSGRRLQGEFGGLYSAQELTDLERGQAIVRLGKAGDSYALRTFAPVTGPEVDADGDAPARIIAATHREICRPRSEVEAGLRETEAQLEALRAGWQAAQERKKAQAKSAEGKSEESQKRKSKTGEETTVETDKARINGDVMARAEAAASAEKPPSNDSAPRKSSLKPKPPQGERDQAEKHKPANRERRGAGNQAAQAKGSPAPGEKTSGSVGVGLDDSVALGAECMVKPRKSALKPVLPSRWIDSSGLDRSELPPSSPPPSSETPASDFDGSDFNGSKRSAQGEAAVTPPPAPSTPLFFGLPETEIETTKLETGAETTLGLGMEKEVEAAQPPEVDSSH